MADPHCEICKGQGYYLEIDWQNGFIKGKFSKACPCRAAESTKPADHPYTPTLSGRPGTCHVCKKPRNVH